MKKIKFEDAIEEYFEHKKMYVRNSTYDSYYKRIYSYALPFFEGKYVDTIDKKIIIEWQKYLFNNHISIKYINKIRSVLHNFFEYLIDYHDLENNPVTQAPRLKDNTPEENMLFWEFDEFQQFIRVVDDQEYYRFFMFLYYTGARKGEARAITWNQIDFKKKVITISRSLERGIKSTGERIVNKPKNGQTRKLIMNKELYDVLYSYYLDRKMHFDFKMNEYVFGINKPLSDTTIASRKNQYCINAGVKQIRIHDFRHSNVSLLISLGADICVICDRLGHKDRNQTLNRYAHMFPTRENEIVAKIDAQASIFNRHSTTLASMIIEFIEKINQLQNLEKNDIIMIENIKKIMGL